MPELTDIRKSPHFEDAGAPTIAELLTLRGVPRQHHERVRLALLDWLHSWQGCTPTNADGRAVLDYLHRMAGGGR